jgi:thiol-disulfide isomerase/thioredoxin
MKNLIKAILLLVGISTAASTSGQSLEYFSLEDLEGEWQTFDDLKGSKVTVIDFWATWCSPCLKAMPKLNTLYEELADEGLEVIGISCDGPRSVGLVDPVINSMSITYPILKDIDCELKNAHGYQAYPTLIILDNQGEITFVHEGFRSGDEKEIEEHIRAMLE